MTTKAKQQSFSKMITCYSRKLHLWNLETDKPAREKLSAKTELQRISENMNFAIEHSVEGNVLWFSVSKCQRCSE